MKFDSHWSFTPTTTTTTTTTTPLDGNYLVSVWHGRDKIQELYVINEVVGIVGLFHSWL